MSRRPPPTRDPVCPYCGGVNTITSHTKKLRGRRTKQKMTFGWLLAIVFTLGAMFPLWLAKTNRGKELGVDRWNECSACAMQW